MYIVRQTSDFKDWLDALVDFKAQVRIAARLRLAEARSLGDWKSVGGSVSEMRVDVGPGYRLYFTRQGNIVIVVLAGGDKSTRSRTSCVRGESRLNWRKKHEQAQDKIQTIAIRCCPLFDE